MAVLTSALKPRSDDFRANAERMAALTAELRAKTATAAQGGSEAARKKYTERGKLLVRDRVNLLLDPGTPFLELSALAANGLYNDEVQIGRAHV